MWPWRRLQQRGVCVPLEAGELQATSQTSVGVFVFARSMGLRIEVTK
jgi:hypothetical protein